MDYTLPDGTTLKGVPEGTSRSEIAARLVNAGQAHRFGVAAEDPTTGMSELDKVRAGWAKFLVEGATGLSQRLGGATTEDVEAMRARDAPLMETTAGKIGYGGSALATGLATGAIPGANTLAGSALIGGSFGAAMPTGRLDDPLHNVLRTATFGGIGQAGGRLLSGAPLIQNRLNPTQQGLLDLAKKHRLDLPTSARTGSPFAGYAESQLATLPGGGSMAAALRRPQEQLGSRVMEQAGVAGPASMATLEAAQKSTQAGFRNIWRDVDIPLDAKFTTALDAARKEANKLLFGAERRAVNAQIDNIWDAAKVTSPSTMAIPGDVYQMGLRGTLRRAGAGKDTTAGHILTDVRKALDGLADRAVGKSSAEALKQLRREYAIQKGLSPLIPAAEARGGRFTPSGLLSEFGASPGAMGELARIGPLLREPPQSGTATRQIASALLLGGPAYVAGGLGPAAAGLAMPWASSQLLSRPAVQRYLAEGAGLLSRRGQELLTSGVRGGALAAPYLLGAQ